MAWTISGGFRQFNTDVWDKTLTTHDLDAAAMIKVGLYNNTVVPDFDATAAASAYGAGGTWTAGNEVSQAVQWPVGGVVMVNNDVTNVAGGITMLDADDTASGSAFTAANIYGCLLYLDAVTTPVADQGLCAIYFGGTAYGLTNGTFTIQWSGSGIYRLDVA